MQKLVLKAFFGVFLMEFYSCAKLWGASAIFYVQNLTEQFTVIFFYHITCSCFCLAIIQQSYWRYKMKQKQLNVVDGLRRKDSCKNM